MTAGDSTRRADMTGRMSQVSAGEMGTQFGALCYSRLCPSYENERSEI